MSDSKRHSSPETPGSGRRDEPNAAGHASTDIVHETGALHRLLVEHVQDYAIFALDPTGVILSWNAGAQRLKGYDAHEIIGKHFSIFYPEERIAQRFPEYELETASRVGGSRMKGGVSERMEAASGKTSSSPRSATTTGGSSASESHA